MEDLRGLSFNQQTRKDKKKSRKYFFIHLTLFFLYYNQISFLILLYIWIHNKYTYHVFIYRFTCLENLLEETPPLRIILEFIIFDEKNKIQKCLGEKKIFFFSFWIREEYKKWNWEDGVQLVLDENGVGMWVNSVNIELGLQIATLPRGKNKHLADSLRLVV